MNTLRVRSILTIKSINEDKRIIEGIASTPSTDRMDDIVEPKGAQFSLPIPLLWMHDSSSPVGQVIAAKVANDGITVTCQFAQVDEPPSLKEDLDRAWAMVKAKLVRGLSIGFMPIESSDIDGTWGRRFTKWDWYELSAVVIPANQDASITAIKSIDDQQLRAALGHNANAAGKVLRTTTPGASGKPISIFSKGNEMKTIKERIAAFQAERMAKAARLQELINKEDGGVTLDAAEKEEFDTIDAAIGEIDSHLKRLEIAEKLNVQTTTTVTPSAGTDSNAGTQARQHSGIVSVKSNIAPGIRFARMAMCVARAKFLQKQGQFMAPDDIYKSEKQWMHDAPEVAIAMKTAVNANDSTTAGNASEWAYAQNIASEFIEYLRPLTLLGRITGWRNVPFNVRVGGMSSGATGYWVGQGLAVPVSKPGSTSITLGITKVGGLCVITKELAMLSTPSAELMIRNDLAKAVAQQADTSLIDPNNGGVAAVTPQSLTYGATARQASGTDFAAFKADWKALTASFYAANIPMGGAVVIMKEEMAEALSMMVTSLGLPQFPSMQDWAAGNARLMGRQVFTTQVADTSGSPDFDNLLILLQPGEVFLADDGSATVEASDQVSIEMSDAPGNKSTATATGASLVSMFQTESVAIKAIRHVNWTKARSQACQYIRTAAYV